VSRRTIRDTHTPPGILRKEALQTPAGKLQTIENKGASAKKRTESKQRGGKLLGTKELTEKAPHGSTEAGESGRRKKNYRATQIDVKTKQLRK
jgi:hypothetical protein